VRLHTKRFVGYCVRTQFHISEGIAVTGEQTTTNVPFTSGIDDSEGTIETISFDYIVIKARIKNIMSYRLETQLSVFNASGSYCNELPADEADNEVIHTILPMPVIGEFD
jgi:hypothetical protein